jgi:tRNA dimethylallyltransferase
MTMSKAIVVTGPTATGKTRLAIELARDFCGEIVSADSRQVYRGMDIGTGKDLSEYALGGEDVPHHLIDIVSPLDEYNLMRFRLDAARAVNNILSRDFLPIVAGGSPLYIDSLISDYDMEGAPPNREFRESLKDISTEELLELLARESGGVPLHLAENPNRKRIIRAIERAREAAGETRMSHESLPDNLQWLIIGVYFHRSEVHKRIEERLDSRLRSGMVDEVRHLHDEQGVSWEKLEFFGLEYKYVSLFLQGELSEREMRDTLLIKIRQFAKRQDIWFRKMERAGHVIHWIPKGDTDEATLLIRAFLNGEQPPKPIIRISEIKY